MDMYKYICNAHIQINKANVKSSYDNEEEEEEEHKMHHASENE